MFAFSAFELAYSAMNSAPRTYKQAVRRPDADEWLDAMGREMKSLHDHDAWDLVPRPEDKPVNRGLWVFAEKMNAKGEVIKKKA